MQRTIRLQVQPPTGYTLAALMIASEHIWVQVILNQMTTWRKHDKTRHRDDDPRSDAAIIGQVCRSTSLKSNAEALRMSVAESFPIFPLDVIMLGFHVESLKFKV